MKTRVRLFRLSFGRTLLAVAMLAALTAGTARPAAAATQLDIVGPAGSGAFGTSVTVLPSGNIVVTDPYYDSGTTADVGAVYLYNGATGALISTLTGSTASDWVGSGGVMALSNGNYVVRSPFWDNGAVWDAGAVTWGSGETGISGPVSVDNSLVGGTGGDEVGCGDDYCYDGVVALSNGNYVVRSPLWDSSSAWDAGAVTWGNGTSGTTGAVAATNSLVGSHTDDSVGKIVALSNGNYVVRSRYWDNGAATDAGAMTWGNGVTGVKGVISAVNSLVGSQTDDWVGYSLTALSNGNYLAHSPYWDNGGATNAGAVTWGDGVIGVKGMVSVANSLVGSRPDDLVGYGSATALSNGNYVVRSPYWDNGAVANAGAATWANGTTGISGPVSPANSLVGSTAGDEVGYGYATGLSNGNYVVSSPAWHNSGAAGAGAATWGNGTTGINGAVSAANSLVGSTAGDQVGEHVTALTNGNYVVSSRFWDNGSAADAGAATWGNGASGILGVLSAANSLVGSQAEDCVGWVTVPSNGNYVVSSPGWDNGAAVNVGAATWGNGTTGIIGPVSPTNSLIGSTIGDDVGYQVRALGNGNYVEYSPYWDNGGAADAGAVTWGNGTSGTSGVVSTGNSLVGNTTGPEVGFQATPLRNGNYVVSSPYWDSGGVPDAGAVTWGRGTTEMSSVVSAANSLVGSTAGDQVGCPDDYCEFGVTALSNGNYVVFSAYWDNGGVADAGAVTWGSGTSGTFGPVTAENSVRGTAGDGGGAMVWDYDYANRQLVVGRPADNIVTLLRPDIPVFLVFLPVVLKNAP